MKELIKDILIRTAIFSVAILLVLWFSFITVTFFWVVYYITVGTNLYTDTLFLFDYFRVRFNV